MALGVLAAPHAGATLDRSAVLVLRSQTALAIHRASRGSAWAAPVEPYRHGDQAPCEGAGTGLALRWQPPLLGTAPQGSSAHGLDLGAPLGATTGQMRVLWTDLYQP